MWIVNKHVIMVIMTKFVDFLKMRYEMSELKNKK